MIARPTRLSGLTGEKAAKILVENCWGEIGVPAVITSDQDTRFVSAFFLTICSLLGIRCAFSHAHRPQGNGRAEVAGRVVKDLLRKICLEQGKSWVEVLPQVLRIKHDLVDPEIGLSPHQLLFGRERAGVGLPWFLERQSEEAKDWMLKQERVQSETVGVIRQRLDKMSKKINQHRRDRMFRPGDLVWVKRPASVGGRGLETFWWGPVAISQQVGLDSFVVNLARTELTVHASQMRLAVEVGPQRSLEVRGVVSKVGPEIFGWQGQSAPPGMLQREYAAGPAASASSAPPPTPPMPSPADGLAEVDAEVGDGVLVDHSKEDTPLA